MTQDDIIRMARSVGFSTISTNPALAGYVDEKLIAFAALACAAEREECADLVQHLRQSIREAGLEAYAMKDALGQAEDAIRARGEKGRAA